MNIPSKTPRTTKSALAATWLAIAALTLSACSSPAGDDPPPGGDPVAAPGTCETPDPVNFVRSTGAAFEILYIAEEQGFFDEHCLDVTITPGSTDTSQHIPMVLNGQADMAMGDPSNILHSIAQGIPIKVASQFSAADSSQPVTDGVLLPPGSPVETGADLEGKNVCLPALGGWMELNARYAVHADGGDHTKVNLIALPTAALQESAESGQCDAIVVFQAYYMAALNAGFTALHNGTNDFDGLPTAMVIASEAWLAQNADVLARFVQAIDEAAALANENDQLTRDVDARYTQLDAETIATRDIPPWNAVIDVEGTQKAADLMYEYGVYTAEVDVAAAIADTALTK
ncbi:ABC transporter substrate-binding protein [Microbacterium album]|uniref:SsuA/THI5-like domain-containing protein n=1 Tax=Microbacterium album TaxID=2053191 RepID=A0A917IGS1_9MICO|nr:ABC transporter substrate-binding protein [Microbacterium album]GGH48442.1 hypothetical protein GCM10010921_25910 [Microbacterium album]